MRNHAHPNRPQATGKADAGQGEAKLGDHDILERARPNVVVVNACKENTCPHEEAALQKTPRVRVFLVVFLVVAAQKARKKDRARDVDDGANHGERVALDLAWGRVHGRLVAARPLRLPAAEEEDREVHTRYKRFDLHLLELYQGG